MSLVSTTASGFLRLFLTTTSNLAAAAAVPGRARGCHYARIPTVLQCSDLPPMFIGAHRSKSEHCPLSVRKDTYPIIAGIGHVQIIST